MTERLFIAPKEEISDETLAAELPERDLVVQMPPVREYIVRVRIKSIEKATPAGE